MPSDADGVIALARADALAFFTSGEGWAASRAFWFSLLGLDEVAVYEALKHKLDGRPLSPYRPVRKAPERPAKPAPARLRLPSPSATYLRDRPLPTRLPLEKLSRQVRAPLAVLPMEAFQLRDVAALLPEANPNTLSQHLTRLQEAGWVVSPAYARYAHVDSQAGQLHLQERYAA